MNALAWLCSISFVILGVSVILGFVFFRIIYDVEIENDKDKVIYFSKLTILCFFVALLMSFLSPYLDAEYRKVVVTKAYVNIPNKFKSHFVILKYGQESIAVNTSDETGVIIWSHNTIKVHYWVFKHDSIMKQEKKK